MDDRDDVFVERTEEGCGTGKLVPYSEGGVHDFSDASLTVTRGQAKIIAWAFDKVDALLTARLPVTSVRLSALGALDVPNERLRTTGVDVGSTEAVFFAEVSDDMYAGIQATFTRREIEDLTTAPALDTGPAAPGP